MRQMTAWISLIVLICVAKCCFSQDSMIWIPQPLFDSIATDAIKFKGCQREVDILEDIKVELEGKVSTLQFINDQYKDKELLHKAQKQQLKADIEYWQRQYKVTERKRRWLGVQRSTFGGLLLIGGISALIWLR